MKFHLTPRRHARPLARGEKPPTPEARLKAIAEGRSRLARGLRKFPQVVIIGFEGTNTLTIEIPDDKLGLLPAIKRELDCESGPADTADAMMILHMRSIAPR